MTAKGHLKLLHGGFEYTKIRVSNEITYWLCVENRKGVGPKKCKGKSKTRKCGQIEVVCAYGQHNHLPKHENIVEKTLF